jgi:hypothetical protein
MAAAMTSAAKAHSRPIVRRMSEIFALPVSSRGERTQRLFS